MAREMHYIPLPLDKGEMSTAIIAKVNPLINELMPLIQPAFEKFCAQELISSRIGILDIERIWQSLRHVYVSTLYRDIERSAIEDVVGSGAEIRVGGVRVNRETILNQMTDPLLQHVVRFDTPIPELCVEDPDVATLIKLSIPTP